MAMTISSRPDVTAAEGHNTRRRYGAAYKLGILAEYESLDRDGKGELLRREDLYTSLLSEWRKQRDRGAIEALAGRPGRPPHDPIERENSRLRHQVERLEGDLLRARTVIEVQGKVSALLEEFVAGSAETKSVATR
jgi:transposase